MNAEQSGQVTSINNQGICTITFEHPAHNSLPGRLLGLLTEAIDKAGADDSCELIILQSTGDRTFCAGASFDELMAINDEVTGKAFFMGFANVINACRKCPKLIIGRIQGKAIGGGVGLASATDYCLATKYAAIKLSELAVGIGPFVVGPAVQRKMGLSAFSQLAIDATQWQNAYWARDKGLFAEVYDSIDEMDEAIDRLSQDLLRSNPAARTSLKQIFWEGTENWDALLNVRAQKSGQLVLSPFSKSAIAKFKSK
jgi:methylglutaconyl-CoA hydratase